MNVDQRSFEVSRTLELDNVTGLRATVVRGRVDVISLAETTSRVRREPGSARC